MIQVSKRDVLWSYFAQFLSIASGIIVLPLILRLLTPQEIGMNYLMLTVGTMVSLLDFGFAPQFGRNFSYIFGGAQILKKEGVEYPNTEQVEINYRLLVTMIHTAKTVYRILSFVVLLVMLTFGTLYIKKITNGFSNVDNSLLIWIVYSISIFFNIYYTYYSSLLTGKGLIMESKKAMVFSKIIYIAITVILLLWGAGLIGVVVANLVTPFVVRYLSYRYFFTEELLAQISSYKITRQEKIDLFSIIWFNAKKLGFVFIGSYAITKFGMFLAGLYLPLSEVASYGIMIQFVNVISSISGTFFLISNPRFSVLKVEQNYSLLLKEFALSMGVFYLIFIFGSSALIVLGPVALELIKSNTLLPTSFVILLYSLVILLESNHAYFATIIVIGNKVPFMWISLLSGGLIVLASFVSLEYSNLGILGLVIMQGVVQLCYNNWKWPMVVLKEFQIDLGDFLKLSLSQVVYKFINYSYDRTKR